MIINEPALNVFMAEGGSLDRVAVMSRYLNGAGMGFFANAAKIAANAEIWAGGKAVEAYKNMEGFIAKRSEKLGGAHTLGLMGLLDRVGTPHPFALQRTRHDSIPFACDPCSAVDYTVIRAGTLKGGALGDLTGDGGEKSFLSPPFYNLGQQVREASSERRRRCRPWLGGRPCL